MKEVEYKRKAVIYKEGQTSSHVYLIAEGEVEISGMEYLPVPTLPYKKKISELTLK